MKTNKSKTKIKIRIRISVRELASFNEQDCLMAIFQDFCIKGKVPYVSLYYINRHSYLVI